MSESENTNEFGGVDEHGGQVSMARPDAPKSKWSLEALAVVEWPHDVVVSPDGKTVAFILDRDMSDIWTVPVAGGLPSRLTAHREPMPYWEDTTPAWSPDGATIAYAWDGSIWTVPSAGGAPKKLVEAGTPAWIDDATLLVMVDRDDETRLATMKLADAWPVAVTPAGQNIAAATVAPGGKAVVYTVFPKDDRSASQIWWLDLETGGIKQLTGTPAMHDGGGLVSPDGSRLAFLSERTGWVQLYMKDLETGEERQVTDGAGDIGWIEWHADSERLVATRFYRGRSALVTIDAADGTITTVADGGYWSESHWAGDSIVAIYEDQRTPASLMRVDPDGTKTALLAGPPGEVRTAPVVPFEEVTYTSFDGLEIHGFLIRPTDAKGPVPAVVYPHGGPTDAYMDGWDGHAQYFVSKGYAWFGINFRGSIGYGLDFERANYGVWGVNDTKDCLAAYEYLASLDWVDSDRVAIFGASYGSYMALCSLAYDPDHRFRCGVAKFGDSNIATSWAQGDRGGREDLEKMMGTPAEAREAYEAGSPIHAIENIERPILVAHGERDERVHPDQSARLVEELKRLDKTFEYVTYPSEAHGFLRREPQIDFYRRLERFLDWHLM